MRCGDGGQRGVHTDGDRRSDEILVAALNRGDASAFDSIYARYRDWVLRLALRFTQNDADALDVLQETFAYFVGKFPGFELRARLTTFLYPAVKHLAYAAAAKRRRATGGDDALQAQPAKEPSIDPAAARSELAALLGALSEPHREVILLRFVDDLELQEIAGALGIPLGTVKSRLHNAIRTLREDERLRRWFEG